jgi:hypothetical protein
MKTIIFLSSTFIGMHAESILLMCGCVVVAIGCLIVKNKENE